MAMKSEDKFGTIAVKRPLNCDNFIGIRYFHNNPTNNLLVWDEEFVYIYTLHDGMDVPNFPERVRVHQCRDIIQIKSTRLFLILDNDGKLYLWNECYSHNDSLVELLEIESHEVIEQCGYPSIPREIENGIVAMCCAGGDNICLLTKTGVDLRLNFCSLIPGPNFAVFFIKIISSHSVSSKSVKDCVGTCMLTYLDSTILCSKFRHQLCPSLEVAESDIVLITLGYGSIICLPLTSEQAKVTPHHTFDCHHHATAVIYEDGVDSPKLDIFLADNSVLSVSPGENRLVYRRQSCPSTQIVCQASHCLVFTSNGSRTWKINTQQTEFKRCSLSVCGITAACNYEVGKLLLTTKDGTVCWISLTPNTSIDSKNNKSGTLFYQIQNVVKQVSNIEESISTEVTVLQELSLLRRIPCLHDLFPISVKVNDVADSNYNFDIHIVNNSELSLTSKFWQVDMRIKGKNIDVCQNHNLVCDFKTKEVIRIVVQYRIKTLVFPIFVNCNLVQVLNMLSNASTEMKGARCYLSLASVCLDISYFCTPISASLHVHDYSQDEHLLQNFENNYSVIINVTEDINLNTIAEILSKNCAHRGMGAIKNSTLMFLRVGTTRLQFEVVENYSVKISCCDSLLLLQMQQYLIGQISERNGSKTKTYVTIDPQIFLQNQGIMLGLDLAEARSTESGLQAETRLLYTTLRQKVTYRLFQMS